MSDIEVQVTSHATCSFGEQSLDPTLIACVPSNTPVAPHPHSGSDRCLFQMGRWFWKFASLTLAVGFVVLDIYLGWATTNLLLGSGSPTWRVAPGTWNTNWHGLALDVSVTAVVLFLVLLGVLIETCFFGSIRWLFATRERVARTKPGEDNGADNYARMSDIRVEPSETLVIGNQELLLHVFSGTIVVVAFMVALAFSVHGLRRAFYGHKAHFVQVVWIVPWCLCRAFSMVVCGTLSYWFGEIAFTF